MVTVEEEQVRPAGKGREEPNSNPRLDDPMLVKSTNLLCVNKECTDALHGFLIINICFVIHVY